MGFKRFEEIDAWQEARKLTKIVYGISRTGALARDFGLRDQIQRASVSIMANVAEGFGSGTNKEFAKFLTYARRSAFEVQALLYAVLDADYIDKKDFDACFEQTAKTNRLITGLRNSLNLHR